MKERILFVDDEPAVLSGLRRLARQRFDVVTAEGGLAALQIVSDSEPFAVVVSDQSMPGMGGTELLFRIHKLSPQSVRMMLTGVADVSVATEAVNRGNIFRFLTKPCSPDALIGALDAGVAQYRLVMAERELLDDTLRGCVQVLSQVLSMVNPTAFGRSERVRRVALMVMEEMGDEVPWWLDVATMLSQIGCVTVPEDLLKRARSGELLTKEEKQIIEEHPRVASQMLGKIPRMQMVGKSVAYQAKRFDGGGHPADGTRGEDIPVGGRLLKLALDFEHLVATGTNPAQSTKAMQSRSGWYDPPMLAALHRVIERGRSADRDELMLDELEVGMILDQNVVAVDGTLLVSAGTEITSPLLRRLDTWGRLDKLTLPIRVLIPVKDVGC